MLSGPSGGMGRSRAVCNCMRKHINKVPLPGPSLLVWATMGVEQALLWTTLVFFFGLGGSWSLTRQSPLWLQGMGWYGNLRGQVWGSPPKEVFCPVWTVLYVTLYASLLLLLLEPPSAARDWGLGFLGANLALNFAWVPLFMGYGQVWVALVDLVLMVATQAAYCVVVWPIGWWMSALLWPYLAWITFAMTLNWQIARLGYGVLRSPYSVQDPDGGELGNENYIYDS